MRRKPAAAPQLELSAVGEGPPVLLLHGLGASSHVWQPLLRCSDLGFRFLQVDLPHCGRGQPWAKLTPAEVAERLAEELRRQQLGPVWALGHSFGGVAALQLAAIAPELLRGVTAAAAPAMGLLPLRSALGSGMADWTMKIASLVRPSARAVRAYLELIRGTGPAPTAGQVQGYLLAMEAEGHHEATLTALRSLTEFVLPAEAIRASYLPVQLVFGERDRLVPVSRGEALAKALGAPLRVIPGAGHCLPEERPDVLRDLLRAGHGMDLARSA